MRNPLRHTRSLSINAEVVRGLILTALIVGAIAVLIFYTRQAHTFSSVEVKFADTSESGLGIVPASCASYPHYAGECSTTLALGTCTLVASTGAIVPGQTATLTWDTAPAVAWQYSGSISPAPGSVGRRGSAVVQPSVTTTYTFQGAHTWLWLNHPFSCSATIVVYQACSLPWGGSITHGQSATAYQASSVGYGQSCASETRSCSNGTLSGSYGYSSCSVTAAAPCSLPWGGSISHGQSTTAYAASTVPYGSSCASQTRSCSNGTLSGSYAYSSCSVTPAANCAFNGTTVLHGNSTTAYSASTVPFGSSCTWQARTCSNGTLSGSYAYSSCSVTPAANCTFSGATVIHGQNVTAYQVSAVPYGTSCTSQVRACSNGTLSGSYTYASCSVGAPPPNNCPSAPLSITSDSGGYRLPPSTVGAHVAIHGYDICVSNSSGNTYFIPIRTASEFSAFVNGTSGAPGVSQRSSSSYPWYCWYGYAGIYNSRGGCS